MNSVKEPYKYLELEQINHFDNQHHLQNLIRFVLVIISKSNSKYLYGSLTEFARRISKRINHCDHNAAHKYPILQ